MATELMCDIDKMVDEAYERLSNAPWSQFKGILRAAFAQVEKQTLDWAQNKRADVDLVALRKGGGE